jgi:Ras-related protein Rab-4B
MVVFSLADRASFDKLPQWLSDAKTQARSDITILIVGNKADLDDERQVSMIEASKLAQSEGCSYMETSARTGENVEPAFFKLSRSVLAKVQDGKLDAASLASRSAPLKKEPTATAEAAASGCSC